MAGITLGLVLFLSYYVLLTGCKGLGNNGILPPALGIWVPNLLAALLDSYLWAKMQRETPMGVVRLWRSCRMRLSSLGKTGC
jgi:lipopolysaccharide export system permease protein